MFRTQTLTKPLYWALAAALVLASITPILMSKKADAYNLVTTRSIQMSSSAGAATNTIYKVSFITASTHNIGSVAVEFCDNTPVIGDSCTAAAGLDVNEGTTQLYNQVGITDWTATPHANTTTNRFVLTRTAASVTAATTVTFDLGNGTNGITNPTHTAATADSFYARITTYTATDGTGTEVDAGGVAMSTAAQITITAKVQERLSFCVYTGANCAAGGTTIALGDTNGVLDFAGPFVDKNAKYDVSTNASGNVAIRLKGTTLASGGNTITAIGNTAAASTTGSEQFGFCTFQASGSGLTASAPYNDATCSAQTSQTAGTGSTGGAGTATFALDTANTNTTYGQTIASKVPGTTSQGVLAFIGNIGAATEAGIYTTTLTFIATGTY